MDAPLLKIEGKFFPAIMAHSSGIIPRITIYSLHMDIYNPYEGCKRGLLVVYTVEPPLSDPLGRVTIRSDNRKVG